MSGSGIEGLAAIWFISQQVSGLAVEGLAQGLQRGEADGFGMAVFQDGEIGEGQVDPAGQFVQAHFPAGHHDIEIDDDRHSGLTSSDCQFVFRLDLPGQMEDVGQDQADYAKDNKEQAAEHGQQGVVGKDLDQEGYCQPEK